MQARSITCLLLVTTFSLSLYALGREQPPQPIGRLLPADTGLVVHARDGNKLLDSILASGIRDKLTGSPQWKKFLESDDGREMQQGLDFLAGAIGHPALETARRILDGEIAFALVAPPRGGPRPIILARPRDPEVLKRVMNALALVSGQPIEQVEHKGVKATVLGDAVYFWEQDTFVLGNHKETLEAVVDRLRGESGSPSLEDSEAYRSSKDKLAGLGPIHMFVNLDLIRERQGGTLKGLEGPFREPLVSLIFGGYRQLLRESRSIAVGLDWTGSSLRLRGIAAPVSKTVGHPCYFPTPAPEAVAAPPGTIARFNIRRNFSAWWDARMQLVGESSHAAMARFATEIGNILGGRDFGEEILALAGPGIELLVIAPGDPPAGQQAPEPRLPGFALAVPLDRGDELAPRLQSLFQTVLTFVNIDLANKDRAPMLLSTVTHGDVTITRAGPPPLGPDEVPGIEANFAPAIAVHKGTLLIASHDHAIKALIDASASQRPQRSTKNGELHIRAGQLRAILESNRRPLIANGVLEGKSFDEATTELNTLLTLIDLFGALNVTLTPTDEGLELTVDLSVNATARPKIESF